MIDRRTLLAAAPLLALPRAAFAQDAPLVAPIQYAKDRLWVSGRIGSEQLLFVIDTGASRNFLRPEIAGRLRLPAVGEVRGSGIGGRVRTFPVVQARDVIVGTVARQPQMQFSTFDFNRGLPPEAAGLFAAGLLTAFDSEFDFERGRWSIWLKGRTPPSGHVRLPAKILRGNEAEQSERIYLDARLDGRPLRLLVDTGSPRSVFLFPQAAKPYFEGARPFAPTQSVGFGGVAKRLSRVVRAERLELGPVRIDQPLVTVSDPGESRRAGYDGIIGLPLIALFTLSTSIRPDGLFAKRNALPYEDDAYSPSGLWIDRSADGRITVREVGAGSPAASADVRPGDELLELPSWSAALALINGRQGRTPKLKLRRVAETREVTLTLSPYL